MRIARCAVLDGGSSADTNFKISLPEAETVVVVIEAVADESLIERSDFVPGSTRDEPGNEADGLLRFCHFQCSEWSYFLVLIPDASVDHERDQPILRERRFRKRPLEHGQPVWRGDLGVVVQDQQVGFRWGRGG